jgi:uncharacterized protein YndB with AHSA1/START domain
MSQTKITIEPGKQEIVIIHECDAPRELVFRAFIEPDLFSQWILGPRHMNLKMKIDKFEARNGGSWRYIHTDKSGNEFAFHGVNHEVHPPAHIIQTSEFEGLKGHHVSLDTANFEELPGGRTRIVAQSVFQSVADRDGMAQSGMEEGVRDSYDRLDELMIKLKEGDDGFGNTL